ncbi:hypothetical protein ATE47_16680 [Chryseobacterium sp. IHB B 17019]|jgi:hypothetical protein|uniref:hypothetical protein n=1 Tax=Chryseobacterium sp. IHB B 17019 TaxID=1721091 RepID=UPI00071FDDED|nr:hypothetical protein [Chryseobacterium sp. IHB B 17019]ALR32052.1 hypothetical protein ATE47_16680 [Chryseobacterium sp. IHB B 17019]
MKKSYLLLPVFFLASCSNGDDDSTNPNENPNGNTPVLVTKMVDDGETYTFTYNGNKIAERKHSSGDTTTYTYTGDLITKIVEKDGSITESTVLTYDSNSRLSKSVMTHTSTGINNYTTTIDYTYVTNNNVKIVETTNNTMVGYTKVHKRDALLNMDNSIKGWTTTVTETQSSGTLTGSGGLLGVSYDSSNSPFKNVTGYLKIINAEGMTGSAHNLLNYSDKVGYTNGGWETTIFSSTFEYNSSSYPTKETKKYKDQNGTLYQTKVITYEYNHL